MKSEALRRTKTMREIKTGLDITRKTKIKTTNSLSRTKEELAGLENPPDRRLPQVLEREKKRFAAHDAALEQSRCRILASRQKLAVTINRNRALTDLRHSLQQSRWENKASLSKPISLKLRQVDLDF